MMMYKYRAEITKGEEVRYISHLDYAGLIERAIRRAKLPAAYSEGFNPHMKIAFASALAVGVTSDAEYMDFELTQQLCQPEVFDKLNKNLPPGVKVLKLKPVREFKNQKKHKALMAEVDLAEYDIYVPLESDWDSAVKAVKLFNEQEEVIYHRVTPKKTKDIEVKQYLAKPVKLAMSGDKLKVTMDIIITQSGSIKPQEILGLLAESYGLNVNIYDALINRRALSGSGKPLIDLV